MDIGPDDRERIVSDEYADILIEYSGDFSIFDQFPDATVRLINNLYAVLHIPAELFTLDLIREWGLSILPKCFGLISLASIEASNIQRVRSIPGFDFNGQGVLVGFLDTGIDYRNPIFRNEDGTSRIVSIWDQTIVSDNVPIGFDFGTEYLQETINAALQTENPLEIVPSMDEDGHGTMLAGIAAGNEDFANNFYGIATGSELVIVKLKQAKQSLREFFLIPEDSAVYSEIDILFGLLYLIEVSNRLRRPIVICLALGTSLGGHDGRGVLSNALSLVGIRAGTAIIIAAGNEGNARRHYFGEPGQTAEYNTVELSVGENEQGFAMELWGETPSFYGIDIISPSGEYIPRMTTNLREVSEISFIFEQTTIIAIYELVETQSGDPVILLRIQNPTPGIWRFNVYETGDLRLGFHMWLPMGRFISDNTFFVQSNIYTTVLTAGTAVVPITVTAYNDSDESLYLYASRGYTRTGVIKPEIAAPGVNVVGPTLQNGFMQFSGTSVSAAHTTGVVALLMEWGAVRGNAPQISTTEIKKFLIRGARRRGDLMYPNQDWGYGILDLFGVFDSVRIVL